MSWQSSWKFLKRWWGLTVAVPAGVLGVLSGFGVSLKLPGWGWGLIAAAGVVATTAEGWRTAAAERDSISSDWEAERAALPIIELGRPHVALEHVSQMFPALSTASVGATGPVGPTGPPLQCARVRVRNASTSHQGSATAQDVKARIRFDPSDIEVHGKWTAQREPVRRSLGDEDLVALGAIDIAPGQSWDLDVAIKYEFEGDCYAFSNDSYGGDFKVPRYRLPGSKWQVTVEVTGTRVGVVQETYSLRVGPQGLELEDIHL